MTSNVARSYIDRRWTGLLDCAEQRFKGKKNKYAELGDKMKPLVIESSGGWHRYSMGYLDTMANAISAHSLMTKGEALNSILTTSSIRLQKHQGTMLARRCLGL